MDSKNQLLYFCLCILVGFLAGLPYEIFAFLRAIFRCDRGKNKTLSVLLDVLYPIFFALICVFMQFILRFPGFRAYMWIGYAVGFIIYLKILRRILAFLQKSCYNSLVKVLRKVNIKKKSPKKGGRVI
ncbi:MAG: spore cortex biosynthesis protein YabQ [Clostridia bacterium]|nr:spore cortex biosynthesis protein YabQ [Clostridia bacterium]